MKKVEIRKKNVKGCGVDTVVRGIRAEESFFKSCDIVAKKEGTTRNELILRAVAEYIERYYGKE